MGYTLTTIFVFYAGILSEAVFLLWAKFERSDIWKFICCLAVAMIALAPGKNEVFYDPFWHFFLVALFFVIAYAFVFKTKILERIDGELLILWDLVLGYLIIERFGWTNIVILLILALSTGLVILNGFIRLDKKFAWRAFFYVLFLCIIVTISACLFQFDRLSLFFDYGNGQVVLFMDMFFTGMAFLYMIANIWYLLELLPLPGKYQNFQQRMTQVKDDIAILASEYDSDNVRKTRVALTIIFTVILFSINYHYHLINDTFLISIIISSMPIFSRVKGSNTVDPNTVAQS